MPCPRNLLAGRSCSSSCRGLRVRVRREVSWNREFKVILNPQWMGGLFLLEKRKNGMEKGR